MPRSLGSKRNVMAEEQLAAITQLYGRFAEGEYCKIFPNAAFGYRRLTVEQPLRDAAGRVLKDGKGRSKTDSSLRDFENVPLLDDPDEYFRREVLPHVPEAFLDLDQPKKGYKINFTRYFYQH